MNAKQWLLPIVPASMLAALMLPACGDTSSPEGPWSDSDAAGAQGPGQEAGATDGGGPHSPTDAAPESGASNGSSSGASSGSSTSGSTSSSGSGGSSGSGSGSGSSSGSGSGGSSGGGVATPTFSPPAGPFYAATPVTISSTTAGATIRYTTDGSTPTETNGTLYTGPVTMQPAVNTNMTLPMVTNASGVTMLKAVAYEAGVDSAVFTGNYIIIDPLRYAKTSSLVLGLAHVAYNVSSQNWNSVLSLWTKYLGYDTVTVSSSFALVKINDQQYIELYQRPIAAPQYQLGSWGFYVSDAEAFRQQLSKAGITVPASCTMNALGNLSFFTTDPDGHQNEWVQYLPGSVTSNSLGQHMPQTQLFGYMDDYGDATNSATAANAYYGKCGFSTNGIKVYLPNNNCYMEMLGAPTSQAAAGIHGKAQLVTFRGTDLVTALNTLQARDGSIAIQRKTEGGGGFPVHNCGDIFDADGSRIRAIDINY
jgi:hypothetical protein